MFVEGSMTRKVITVDQEADIFEAQRLMAENKFRHLPVVDERGILIGIVTDRDVRSAMPYELAREKTDRNEREKLREKIASLHVRDIMATDLIKVGPMDTIQDALLLVQRSWVGALPVVDETGRLEGIISVRDLLRAFINVLGIGEPGTLLGILVEQKIGQMKRIVDAITEENISFGSILVARYWDEDKRAVFPYLLTQNIGRVKRKLHDMGFTLIDPMDWYVDELPKND
jgi:acetoin utilization protein AcuB